MDARHETETIPRPRAAAASAGRGQRAERAVPAGPGEAGGPADVSASRAWGAYCLCNDVVLDWALALFESLRTYEPELELRLIPYDERMDEIARVAARFGYSVLESPEIAALDALGRRFYPEEEFAARGFRKLAAFQGPFDRFFSFDSDVVVLGPLGPLGRAIESAGADLAHFDTDLDQVYRPGPLRDELVAGRDARGFNAGLFAARRGWLSSASLAAEPGSWAPAGATCWSRTRSNRSSISTPIGRGRRRPRPTSCCRSTARLAGRTSGASRRRATAFDCAARGDGTRGGSSSPRTGPARRLARRCPTPSSIATSSRAAARVSPRPIDRRGARRQRDRGWPEARSAASPSSRFRGR